MKTRLPSCYRCALLVLTLSTSAAAQDLGSTDGVGGPVYAPGYAALVAESLPPPPPAAEVTPASYTAPIPQAPPTPAEPTPVEVVEAIGAAAAPPVDEATLADVAPVESASWWRPYAWLPRKKVDSGVELGLNGASGTSESVSFRTGGYMKSETDDHKFDSSLYYNKTSADGVDVQSNALLNLRYDFLFGESPWTLFMMSQTFYDEFQAFDLNVNVNTGVGYRWVDEEWMSLTTSFGAGASREFGDAVQDEWVPEASFGLNYEQSISDSQRFYAKADYFPQWEDFSAYRVVADMGLEIDLPRPSNMTLKFSATDRYDSQPSGAEPHNLNYSASLLWKL